jgi:DNA-directed RNA polymerase I subunit RPA43
MPIIKVGKVNLCSPDHISLLVHRTFNVSIPRHHIPADTWEFEYGPAENDPEFGSAVQQVAEDDVGQSTEDQKDHAFSRDSGGRWVHRITGDILGDNGAPIEFTVIGYVLS